MGTEENLAVLYLTTATMTLLFTLSEYLASSTCKANSVSQLFCCQCTAVNDL